MAETASLPQYKSFPGPVPIEFMSLSSAEPKSKLIISSFDEKSDHVAEEINKINQDQSRLLVNDFDEKEIGRVGELQKIRYLI